jgi:hypothetical protein
VGWRRSGIAGPCCCHFPLYLRFVSEPPSVRHGCHTPPRQPAALGGRAALPRPRFVAPTAEGGLPEWRLARRCPQPLRRVASRLVSERHQQAPDPTTSTWVNHKGVCIASTTMPQQVVMRSPLSQSMSRSPLSPTACPGIFDSPLASPHWPMPAASCGCAAASHPLLHAPQTVRRPHPPGPAAVSVRTSPLSMCYWIAPRHTPLWRRKRSS